ncbi:MAG: enoyl-CoA hydratase-related protein [Chloroflexota bacterium]
MSELLRVEREGVVARVTLTRPEVRNAFNAALIGELRATFEAFAAEPAEALRAVVLAGEGTTFCAGADVEWMRASIGLSVEANERDATAMAEMFATVDSCPVPVIARVQGAALGGGMGLCAVADVVLATADAAFGFTETRLGIVPAVISPFVLAKIGVSAARALFPTGERFDAERARRIALVHEVLPDETALDARLEAVLNGLRSAGPIAVRGAKALIHDQRDLSPDEVRALTVQAIARHRASAEGQEGLSAFIEKRPPAWGS